MTESAKPLSASDRYVNGKIYKLVSDKTDDIYIGSTCMTLCKRLYSHKCRPTTTTSKLFVHGDIKIVLVENYSCASKDELFRRERWHIENNICINKYRPIISPEERREEKKEHTQQYRADNRAVYLEYQRQYRAEKKNVILEHQRQYYAKNKSLILEHQRQYRADNQAAISERARQRYANKKASV